MDGTAGDYNILTYFTSTLIKTYWRSIDSYGKHQITLHHIQLNMYSSQIFICTDELEYDGLNGTRKIGPSYAKSVIYI